MVEDGRPEVRPGIAGSREVGGADDAGIPARGREVRVGQDQVVDGGQQEHRSGLARPGVGEDGSDVVVLRGRRADPVVERQVGVVGGEAPQPPSDLGQADVERVPLSHGPHPRGRPQTCGPG